MPGVYELHPYRGRLHIMNMLVEFVRRFCLHIMDFYGFLGRSSHVFSLWRDFTDQFWKLVVWSRNLELSWAIKAFIHLYTHLIRTYMVLHVHFIPLRFLCFCCLHTLYDSLTRFEVSLAFPCWRFIHSSTSSMLLTHRQAWHNHSMLNCACHLYKSYSVPVCLCY